MEGQRHPKRNGGCCILLCRLRAQLQTAGMTLRCAALLPCSWIAGPSAQWPSAGCGRRDLHCRRGQGLGQFPQTGQAASCGARQPSPSSRCRHHDDHCRQVPRGKVQGRLSASGAPLCCRPGTARFWTWLSIRRGSVQSPVFSQTKKAGESRCIAMPDFSFQGWPEPRLPHWSTLV